MRCKIIGAFYELAGVWVIFVVDFVEKRYHTGRKITFGHEMAYARHQKQNQHTMVTCVSFTRLFDSLCFVYLG